MQWMAQHARLQAVASADHGQDRPRFNPKPAGTFIPGSTTQRVHDLLRSNPARSFRHTDLMRLTSSTSNALIWSCAFLVRCGHITRRLDSMAGRERYRYQWKGE